MAAALNEDYQRTLDEQKKEVRELVMDGLEQIKRAFFYLTNTTYMLYSVVRKKKERIIDDTAQLLLYFW